ncbi:protein PTCD3 homolog, mitochondrial-like isoform X1 [Paramacrobiotus metropolitanus]|uniref:protein PTCD3 homolog, mitochondrial-like isoform X1 n=1 Tax=Paramacrobiotus metropolitanus TaxID=2943436 RepID=UPI0024457313|nr:protein PTCD3 homolog, mitochondrial-like isoform X1 [Paramacrobiotus metropolitanus]
MAQVLSRGTLEELCKIAARWRVHGLGRRGFAAPATNARTDTSAEPMQPSKTGPTGRVKIKVPKRIDRSPTAILETLASTVGRDPTAPHYRFMDDPYFIPTNNLNKRGMALSKESGRKAARYMIKKFPDIVEKPHAEPTIPAFLPASVADPKVPDSCTEQDMVQFMRSHALATATAVWKSLKQQGVSIAAELEEELLQRLCFTNSESIEPDQVGLPEERWYVHYLQKEMQPKWKIGGLADEVFNGMQTKSPVAYSAMICGTAKYLAVDIANTLFTEMEQQNMPMTVDVFNAMLGIVRYLRDDTDSRWELAMSLLSKMDYLGIAPNLHTFNNVLDAVSRVAMWRKGRDMALATVAEMYRCGIEPSLATFSYLLNIFCRERGPVSHILHDILPFIENNKWTAQDVRDTQFWAAAMEVATRHLQDPEAAKRVHSALMANNNTDFIVNAHKEQMYYNNFLKFLVVSETVEGFMSYYDDLIPMTFTPDVALVVEIMRMLETHDRLDLLPRIWSDTILFGFALKENIVDTILEIMLANGDEKLDKRFSIIAQDIQNRINKQTPDRAQLLRWTGQRCGAVSSLLLRFGLIDEAWSVLNMYIAKQDEFTGVPSAAALSEAVDALLSKGKVHLPKLKTLLKLANDVGFDDVTAKVDDIVNKLALGEEEAGALRVAAGANAPRALKPGSDEE